ncbi:DUF533 domain-containing protein [Aliidiomarina iranensis]|uniref:DUF533 domain-containing protein n=1 Tax=Aliidiomarina iranensis TaxID=1434071 RepID=A0A432VWH3_9GAMM|nr:tellurite resistance TerB family protein [Aliidiomarina iranensis]RUO20905.1 DUF533 domain-containing protein [Aliidiomarina iranensis]
MSSKNLLNQLLQSGSQFLGNSGGSGQTASPEPKKAGGFMNSFGGGAVTGGALGLLLGSKKGRKIGGSALKYGGIAALGVVAYKAYNNYQQNNRSAPQNTPQTIDRVPEPEVEIHSQAILSAIIAAAKADGHIDQREQQLIDDELAKLNNDQAAQNWFHAELGKPLDPAEVAKAASTPEIAAEMYLASVFVVDQQNFMERSYLQELARQLNLPENLKQELDTQAQAAIGSAQ